MPTAGQFRWAGIRWSIAPASPGVSLAGHTGGRLAEITAFLGEAALLAIGTLVLYLHWTGVWEFRGMAMIFAAIMVFCGAAMLLRDFVIPLWQVRPGKDAYAVSA